MNRLLRITTPSALAFAALALAPATLCSAQADHNTVLTGQAAFTNWNQQSPGTRHKITVADLPGPKPDEAVSNGATVVPRPAGALPVAPPGFKVTLYAGGDTAPTASRFHTSGTFNVPRRLVTAPNGDIFLSDFADGTIFVLRGVNPDGKAAQLEKFATGLTHPFGIAFYPADNPRYVYVAGTVNVVRFPYHSGDLQATGPAETVVPELPGAPEARGHSTRDVVFTKDGQHMLVSVGSGSNVDDPDTHASEFRRADVVEYTPDGKFVEVYASGIRNCVGEAINPTTGDLWCSTNERDNLGNHLVPDYVTSVPEHSFFGWPWYYMGGHQDPRLPQPCANGSGPNPQIPQPLNASDAASCKRVDLSSKVRTPDVLVQPHMASLELTFYPLSQRRDANSAGNEFPKEFGSGGAFVAEHGSWNRDPRAGYEVIYIPMQNGHATGEYDDFLTGFVTPQGQVWGRPVGVAVAKDGSLLVSDDGSRAIWRVSYTGGK